MSDNFPDASRRSLLGVTALAAGGLSSGAAARARHNPSGHPTAEIATGRLNARGAVAQSLQNLIDRELPITPDRFGAKGDGESDDTEALAAMAAYVQSLCDAASDPIAVRRRPQIYFPPGQGYRVTRGIVIDGWADIVMDAPLLIDAPGNDPVTGIRWKNNRAGGSGPRDGVGVFDVRRLIQSDWSSETDIGVLIDAAYVAEIRIKRTDGFCVGFDLSNAYGRVVLGDHRGNKKSIVQHHGEQFANHCHLLGGAFSVDGANPGQGRYGIELRGNPEYGLNSILMDGQGYELVQLQAGEKDCYPLLLTGAGNSVRAINQRSETNGAKFAKITGAWRNVEIGLLDAEVSYAYPTSTMLDDSSVGGGSNIIYRHSGATGPLYKPLFDSGRLAEKAVCLTGGTVTIQNMESATSVGAAPARQTFRHGDFPPSFDREGYFAQGSSMYGVRVRLNGERTLGFTGSKRAGSRLNMSFLCFDAAGAQITSTGAVRYESTVVEVNAANFGGHYSVGIYPPNDATRFDAVISFAADVAVVFIAVPTNSSSLQILTTTGAPTWFSTTSPWRDQFVGSETPMPLANVDYQPGMRVLNHSAVLGSPLEWVRSGSSWVAGPRL